MSWVALIVPVLYIFLPILFLGNNKVQKKVFYNLSTSKHLIWDF